MLKRQIERAGLRYEKFYGAVYVLYESLESDLEKIFKDEEPEHIPEPSTDNNDRHAKNPAEEELKGNPFEDDLKVRDVELSQVKSKIEILEK